VELFITLDVEGLDVTQQADGEFLIRNSGTTTVALPMGAL